MSFPFFERQQTVDLDSKFKNFSGEVFENSSPVNWQRDCNINSSKEKDMTKVLTRCSSSSMLEQDGGHNQQTMNIVALLQETVDMTTKFENFGGKLFKNSSEVN